MGNGGEAEVTSNERSKSKERDHGTRIALEYLLVVVIGRENKLFSLLLRVKYAIIGNRDTEFSTTRPY
jgi:hypothetical protein